MRQTACRGSRSDDEEEDRLLMCGFRREPSFWPETVNKRQNSCEGDFQAEKKSFNRPDEEPRNTGMKLVLVPKRRWVGGDSQRERVEECK